MQAGRRVSISLSPFVLGTLLFAAVGGCSEFTWSYQLATLPDGADLHAHAAIRGLHVARRTIVFRDAGGHEQSLDVKSGELGWDRGTSPRGYEVWRDADRITVWKIDGRDEYALATVTLGDDSGAVLGRPQRGVKRTGERIACRIRRILADVQIDEGESVRLSVHSVRDAGLARDKDTLQLAWTDRRPGVMAGTHEASTEVASFEGEACLEDPLSSMPHFEVRWDDREKATWVVDLDTGEVLGGIQLAPYFLRSVEAPSHVRPWTGRVIASWGDS